MSDAPPASASPAVAAWSVERVAWELANSERTRTDRGRITADWPEFSLAEAYEAQAALIRAKQAEGQSIVGVKLGLTSRAKQVRMGISSPLTGVLTDGMVLEAGVALPLGDLIHPRVEPEIVFVLGSRLSGPGITAASALAAVASVHAGLEVIDSRYRDFDFALADVVADNASSSRFVVSAIGISPVGLNLELEACVLRRNGEVVDTATGAAVQGNPLEALALAANALAERGQFLEGGSIVLTGGMTDAIFVSAGDTVSVDFTSLGSLSLPVSAPSVSKENTP